MSSIVEIRPTTHVGDFIRKFGYNGDVDASTGADEDIIAVGGSQTFLDSVAAAADIDIVSSDAADTAAGTGARSIRIEGLDADHMLQSETVELDGTTDVHPTLDYLRIHRASIVTTGSGNINAGNITIDIDGSNVLAYIPANEGQTQQATYTIPANYKAGWLLGYDASLGDSGTVDYAVCRLQTRPYDCGWRSIELFQVSNTVPFVYRFAAPIKLEPKMDIRLRVIDASADDLVLSGGFEIYLEP